MLESVCKRIYVWQLCEVPCNPLANVLACVCIWIRLWLWMHRSLYGCVFKCVNVFTSSSFFPIVSRLGFVHNDECWVYTEFIRDVVCESQNIHKHCTHTHTVRKSQQQLVPLNWNSFKHIALSHFNTHSVIGRSCRCCCSFIVSLFAFDFITLYV